MENTSKPFGYYLSCFVTSTLPFIGGLTTDYFAKNVSAEDYYDYHKDATYYSLFLTGTSLVIDCVVLLDPSTKLTAQGVAIAGFFTLGYSYNLAKLMIQTAPDLIYLDQLRPFTEIQIEENTQNKGLDLKETYKAELTWLDYLSIGTNFIPYLGGLTSKYLGKNILAEAFYHNYYKYAIAPTLALSIGPWLSILWLGSNSSNFIEQTVKAIKPIIVPVALITVGYMYNLYELQKNFSQGTAEENKIENYEYYSEMQNLRLAGEENNHTLEF